MKVKAKGTEDADIEVGFLCDNCGNWDIIPIAIPFMVRKMYGGQISEYEEEKEIRGSHICSDCEEDFDFESETGSEETDEMDRSIPEDDGASGGEDGEEISGDFDSGDGGDERGSPVEPPEIGSR